MATEPHTAPPPSNEPVRMTTRRGIATASFALGLWGTLVFWWYPFRLFIASFGLVIGLIALACG